MIEIRLAKHDDLTFIKDTYKRLDKAMMSLYSELVDFDVQEDENIDLHANEYWMSLIQKETGYILVGLENNIPVGMAVIENVDAKECHLEDLYVYEQNRNKGMGKRLIYESKKMAKEMGFTNMSLNVLPNNKNARGMYEDFGFIETRIRMNCNLG